MDSGITALANAFRKLSCDLRSTLDASSVNPDAGSKGDIREAQLLNALRPHLPSRFEMQLGGVVVNAKGEVSTPQDIVITDSQIARPFMFGNGVHPVEAVCAVLEVKTLYSKAELTRGVKQVASVKRLLKRTLIRPDERATAKGRKLRNSLFGAVFCYGATVKPETVADNFIEACSVLDRVEWPDTICVLDQFTTQWRSDTNMVVPLSAGSSSTSQAQNLVRYDSHDAALFLYMLLMQQLARYRPPPLDLMWYLSNSNQVIEFDVLEHPL